MLIVVVVVLVVAGFFDFCINKFCPQLYIFHILETSAPAWPDLSGTVAGWLLLLVFRLCAATLQIASCRSIKFIGPSRAVISLESD